MQGINDVIHYFDMYFKNASNGVGSIVGLGAVYDATVRRSVPRLDRVGDGGIASSQVKYP